MSERHELQVLVDGLGIPESPRWHDGRLWFSNWGTEEVVAVDLDDRRAEVDAPGRPGMGWATAWLLDGRMLITGETLLRRDPDGAFVEHANVRAVCTAGCDEIVVDGRGNVYVNSIAFDFAAGATPSGGVIALITPDGTVRQVAGDLVFPNGMAITPDNRTLIVAESFANQLTAFDIADDGSLANRRVWADVGDGAPDGICLDAQGAVWYADVPNQRAVRVEKGGSVLDSIELDRGGFACMLAGDDRQTLCIAAATWTTPEEIEHHITNRTGRIYTTRVEVPGVGWP